VISSSQKPLPKQHTTNTRAYYQQDSIPRSHS